MEHPFCGVFCYLLTSLVPLYSYAKFMAMAAKGEILPENLPPTERAAVQHSLRVHLQAVAWQTIDKNILRSTGMALERREFHLRTSHDR